MGGLRSCGECGYEVSESARFCEQCGAAVAPGVQPLRAPDALAEKIGSQRSAIEGERKQVTVMFADIVSSMELTRSLETEDWGLVLDRFLSIGSRAIHDVEGTVHQFTGDGLMAVFGAPLAHEDHARRACLATLRFQSDLDAFAADVAREHGIDFRVRFGLNSGEVIVGDIGEDLHMDFAPIGNTGGMAKRMESLAPAGSTAISASTAALVKGEFELRELGEFDVKGIAEPQAVFELVGVSTEESRREAAEARGLSRFVGRTEEQAKLEVVLDHVLAGEGRVVAISGEAGVGKSRLCREFVRISYERGLTVHATSAVAHGRNIPLLPVFGMFRNFFGIAEGAGPDAIRRRIETQLLDLDASFEPELPLLFEFLGVADPQRPAERIDPEARQRRLLALVRRLVEARSRQEPGVIVIEDLHWLDEASIPFLEQLIAAADESRILLVLTFRPHRTGRWVELGRHESIDLAPLSRDASAQLIRELLGTDSSLDRLAGRLREHTAGNPFFIEEMVRALAETKSLEGARGDYRLAAPLGELVLPPTVQAVLAARIDRLPASEKSLLQTMSVIGRQAPHAVVAAVADMDGAALGSSLAGLQSAGFLTVGQSNAQRVFTLRHPLTQQVAYDSQLSARRAAAHAAVADAIERLYPDGLDERAALVAQHNEAAGRTLPAAHWHGRAAVWISASSPSDAMRHWRRVRELTDSITSSPEVDMLGTAARLGILSLAWRLGTSHEEAAAIHAEGVGRMTDPRAAERVLFDMAYGGTLFLGRREKEGSDWLRGATDRAFDLDDAGLALSVGWSAAFALWVLGPLSEGVDLAGRAIRLAGDNTAAGAGLVLGCPYAACLWTRGLCAGYTGALDQAWADYEYAIELAREHRDLETESYAFASRGVLRADIYDREPALEDAERAVVVAEKSGSVDGLVSAYTSLAFARLHAADYAGADAAAARALDMADGRQVALENEPVLLAVRARATLALGDPEDALATAVQATAIAEDRSLGRLGIWTFAVLAHLLVANEGLDGFQAAETALRRAFGLVRESEAVLEEPRIRIGLAALARLQGDQGEAERHDAEAKRILDRCAAPPGSFDAMREAEVGAWPRRVGATPVRRD